MPFSITDFRSSFEKEPQHANAFEVFLFPPLSLLPMFGITNARNFNFRCSAVNVPGKLIRSIDFMHGGYGPLIKIANASAYDEIQLEVIMSQTTLERQMFLSWMEFIHPLSQYNTQVKYYDSYVGNAIITTFDSEGRVNHLIRVQNCYPIALSSLDLNWKASNQTVSFRVAMAQERIQVISPIDLPGGAASQTPWPELSTVLDNISSVEPGLQTVLSGLGSVARKLPNI